MIFGDLKYSPDSAKFESKPYSLAERELIKVFFNSPFSIRVIDDGEISPSELNLGQNPGEKSSKIENLGDNLILDEIELTANLYFQ